MKLNDAGLLGCGRCDYVWRPLYDRIPKRCPRCRAELSIVGVINPDLPLDIAELVEQDFTLYQRQQLHRAITLYISDNLAWYEILLDWLRGEPELDYYL